MHSPGTDTPTLVVMVNTAAPAGPGTFAMSSCLGDVLLDGQHVGEIAGCRVMHRLVDEEMFGGSEVLGELASAIWDEEGNLRLDVVGDDAECES